MSKKPGRTGFPLTNPVPGKWGNAASDDNADARTILANQRFVIPGTVFCSISIVGTRVKAAHNTTGPELYPPKPTTRRGAYRRMMAAASTRPRGTRAKLRANRHHDCPTNPPARIRSSENPSRESTRVSRARPAPTNTTSISG